MHYCVSGKDRPKVIISVSAKAESHALKARCDLWPKPKLCRKWPS